MRGPLACIPALHRSTLMPLTGELPTTVQQLAHARERPPSASPSPVCPRFATLTALRHHLKAVGAEDWADNRTLTQTHSRRLAVLRHPEFESWWIIIPGAGLQLGSFAQCRTRKQALALAAAVEAAIDLPWDVDDIGPRAAAWRSPAGEDLAVAVMGLRAGDPGLDHDGLYGTMATDLAARQATAAAQRARDAADGYTDEVTPPDIKPGDEITIRLTVSSRSAGLFPGLFDGIDIDGPPVQTPVTVRGRGTAPSHHVPYQEGTAQAVLPNSYLASVPGMQNGGFLLPLTGARWYADDGRSGSAVGPVRIPAYAATVRRRPDTRERA